MTASPPPIDAERAAALWAACMESMAQQVPEQQFNTWLKPLQVRPSEHGLVIEVENRFKLDWVRNQYLQPIAARLEELHQAPIAVDLSIAARQPRAGVVRRRPAAAIPAAARPVNAAPTAPEESPWQDASLARPEKPITRVNPDRTFDNLVEGSANRMARAAALHIAQQPGTMYNPLFIYGGVGVGKTHLL